MRPSRILRCALALMMAVILTACAPVSLLTASPTPYVSLEPAGPSIVVENNRPVLQDHSLASVVNGIWADYFEELATALDALSLAGLTLTPRYNLTPHAGGWQLSVSVVDESGRELDLSTVEVLSVVLPSQNTLAPLADAEFLADTLALSTNGITLPLLSAEDNVSTDQAYAALIALYEDLSGQPVDESNILSGIKGTQRRKAYALGLLQFYYNETMPDFEIFDNDNEPIRASTLLQLLGDLSAIAHEKVFGTSANTATASDLVTLLDTYDAIFKPGTELFDKQGKTWRELLPEPYLSDPSTALTREDVAVIFVHLYETFFSPIVVEEGFYEPVYGNANPAVDKVVSQNLMSAYPSYNDFSHYRPVRMMDLDDICTTFYERLWWVGTQNADTSQSPSLYSYINAKTFARALRIFQQSLPEPAPIVTKTVINDRPYDWFITQNDASPYASINCMPTSTAMVLKWLNQNSTITPAELRNLYPDETGGWTMWYVERTLTAQGVPFENRDITIDNMIADLDAGRLLFCQMNEGDMTVSGHVFVVYGYEQIGDTTWFLAYDPLDDLRNAFGERHNAPRRVEAGFAQWIMSRFVGSYLAIDPA